MVCVGVALENLVMPVKKVAKDNRRVFEAGATVLEKLEQREERERAWKLRSPFEMGQGGKGRFEKKAKRRLKNVP